MLLNKTIGVGNKFYPLFTEQSNIALKESQLLQEILNDSPYERKKELFREIKESERKGDSIDAKISETLYRTHAAPFKREDIQKLGHSLEAFIDLIHDSAKKIVIYHPLHIDNSLVEIANFINEDAMLIKEATTLLTKRKKHLAQIGEICTKIKEIEQEVDDIYDFYLGHLFEAEKNAIELVKCKNIVQSLEDTTDAAKEVADCIKMILLER